MKAISLLGLGLRVPLGQRLDVLGRDDQAVLGAQQVFQQDLQRKRQLGDRGMPFGDGVEPENAVVPVTHSKSRLAAEVIGHDSYPFRQDAECVSLFLLSAARRRTATEGRIGILSSCSQDSPRDPLRRACASSDLNSRLIRIVTIVNRHRHPLPAFCTDLSAIFADDVLPSSPSTNPTL